MFQLLMQPSSGQVSEKQVPKWAHNMGSHNVHMSSSRWVVSSVKNISVCKNYAIMLSCIKPLKEIIG
jgi:hypothetical protein